MMNTEKDPRYRKYESGYSHRGRVYRARKDLGLGCNQIVHSGLMPMISSDRPSGVMIPAIARIAIPTVEKTERATTG